jgi:hypothetical protein
VTSANRLLDAATEIQRFCEEQGWVFYFIDGIAVQHWGEARLTRDADLTVVTGVGDEARYADALLARFAARIDDAREFSLRHRVLLLSASNGIPIDLALGALAFEEHAATTAAPEQIAPDVWLRLCAPDTLIVYKVFAGRPRDWLDVDGIIAKSGTRIDWGIVRSDLHELLALKEDSESLPRLEALLARQASA